MLHDFINYSVASRGSLQAVEQYLLFVFHFQTKHLFKFDLLVEAAVPPVGWFVLFVFAAFVASSGCELCFLIVST